MKTQKLLGSLLTGLFIIGIIIPMQAQETGEKRNLFKRPVRNKIIFGIY